MGPRHRPAVYPGIPIVPEATVSAEGRLERLKHCFITYEGTQLPPQGGVESGGGARPYCGKLGWSID